MSLAGDPAPHLARGRTRVHRLTKPMPGAVSGLSPLAILRAAASVI